MKVAVEQIFKKVIDLCKTFKFGISLCIEIRENTQLQ